MLAVSMGDQAGSLCCLKAELSGLRDRGPVFFFPFDMAGNPQTQRERKPEEPKKLRANSGHALLCRSACEEKQPAGLAGRGDGLLINHNYLFVSCYFHFLQRCCFPFHWFPLISKPHTCLLKPKRPKKKRSVFLWPSLCRRDCPASSVPPVLVLCFKMCYQKECYDKWGFLVGKLSHDLRLSVRGTSQGHAKTNKRMLVSFRLRLFKPTRRDTAQAYRSEQTNTTHLTETSEDSKSTLQISHWGRKGERKQDEASFGPR